MNRLQKKCFMASAGMHLLLVLILFVGPAFFAPKNKSEETQYLELIPSKLVDGPVHMAGGGPPAVQNPAPPAPPPPARQPDPPPQRDPDPPRAVTRNDPEPDPVSTRRRPAISTTPVTRRTTQKATSKSQTTTDNREQQQADNRRVAAANLVRDARQTLRSGLSSGTEVVMPGSGVGEAYASYASAVRSIYEQAWIPPDDAENNNAVTRVRVTIEHTGKVLSASIISPCGETVIDRSVQRTLDQVTFIRPFPEGTKDKQRTYIINFNLKAKLGIG